MGLFGLFGAKYNNAIEITDDLVKIVQAHRSSQRKILKLALRPLPTESQEAKSTAIRTILSELGIKPVNFVSSIPRNLTTIRNLKLPSVKDTEIDSMVEYQATKQIPYSKEEIIVDYQIKSKSKDGFSEVMLVIVHRNIINRHLDILAAAGIQATKVCLGSEAILNWYKAVRQKNEDEEAAVALLDLDTDWINFGIICKDMLLFTRSFSIGKMPKVSEMQEGQKEAFLAWQARLTEEIRRTHATYKMEKLGPRFGKIILVGADNVTQELAADIEREFNVPVEALEPFENLELPQSIKKEELLEQNISLTSCLGLALAPSQIKVDLLPVKLRKERELQRKKKSLSLMLVLLLLIVAFSGFLFAKRIYDKKNLLQELNEQIMASKPKANRLTDMAKRTQLIKRQLNVEGSCLDILYEIYNIIPAQVSINIFTFDEDKLVTLRGSSKKMSDVLNLVDTLEKSDYFQKVEVKYASKRKVRGIELTDFQLHCPLTKLK